LCNETAQNSINCNKYIWGNTSTDDSTVEIGWDNNSPKTSQVLKQKRRLFNFLYLNFKAVLT